MGRLNRRGSRGSVWLSILIVGGACSGKHRNFTDGTEEPARLPTDAAAGDAVPAFVTADPLACKLSVAELTADPKNCGRCGNDCSGEEDATCQQGRCIRAGSGSSTGTSATGNAGGMPEAGTGGAAPAPSGTAGIGGSPAGGQGGSPAAGTGGTGGTGGGGPPGAPTTCVGSVTNNGACTVTCIDPCGVFSLGTRLCTCTAAVAACVTCGFTGADPLIAPPTEAFPACVDADGMPAVDDVMEDLDSGVGYTCVENSRCEPVAEPTRFCACRGNEWDCDLKPDSFTF